jgi:exodeoxyribonuclease V beta subunit
MNAIVADDDPGMNMPLSGLQLIEASAGTGKTWTLATLVLRLVIERGLLVDRILAVTYTEAATQELRERLRERLQQAARIAAGAADVFARPADESAIALITTLIERRLGVEPAATLQARLRRAAQQMDLGPVFTIHGFCARVLAEHALDSDRAFTPAEMIGSERPLLDDVAADLWRTLSVDAAQADLLVRRWKEPAGLAKELDTLLAADVLLPLPPMQIDDPLPLLRRAEAMLRDAMRGHGAAARLAIEASIMAKILSGVSYKRPTLDAVWRVMTQWTASADDVALAHDKLHLLTPEKLTASANKGKHAQVPRSPVFDAMQELLAVQAIVDVHVEANTIALAHHVRELARKRLAVLKRQRHVQTYDDLIAGVADALDGPTGETLAQQLRTQYAVALVDEFQDTDARQWRIFHRVFGDDGLFLIGDPKQAIYRFRGGDVQTYLAAAATPGLQRRHLTRNFRSRPLLLGAIDALYQQAGDAAFIETGISFEPVAPGGGVADSSFLRGDAIAPAITLRVLPSQGSDARAWDAEASRAKSTAACVAEIHALLHAGRGGTATIDGRGLRPGDIAVLVARHADAARMQRALALAGIPAVTASKLGLFQTDDAEELLWLFEALLHPADEGRMRAALASVLLGQDAAAIDRLDRDVDWHRQWQLRLQGWRERWERHGPMAMLDDVCAHCAPRLLGLTDGERRLTNTLQLAELLQEASARSLGQRGLVDWLQRQIVEADDEDETRQLRLESDAERVQIMTLHKSKGQEFPLVFLPFAALPRKPRNDKLLVYHHDGARITQMQTRMPVADAFPWDEARARGAREDEAEAMRLLYVGLTRAQHAVWLAWGPLHDARKSALGRLLGAAADDPQRLSELASVGAIRIDNGTLPIAVPTPLPPESVVAPPPARIARRALRRDWWVYSFSLLKREQSGADATSDERGAEDEAGLDLAPTDTRFTGTRFGNALHLALEGVDFARWRDWRADAAPPPGEETALSAALRREGYADADIGDGLPLLGRLIREALNTRMPEGARLCDLPVDARRAEMEFHFAMGPVEVDALLALLHAHGVSLARHGFGLRRRIEGLMTGKIDLVYAHDGRFHVLDYKSNRLPDYGADTLAEAIRESEYDLQYLIYTLALHRWLRFRIGDRYDYDTHVGGVRYLFCRGLDAQANSGAGVYATRPSRALIDALDALFAIDVRSAA